MVEGLIVYLARRSDSVRKRVRAVVENALDCVFRHSRGRKVDLKILMWSWRCGGCGGVLRISLTCLCRLFESVKGWVCSLAAMWIS